MTRIVTSTLKNTNISLLTNIDTHFDLLKSGNCLMILWLYCSSNYLVSLLPLLVCLTLSIIFQSVYVNMTIRHFSQTSLSSHPIVQKDVNVTISMVRNVNPCALFKKIQNVIRITRESKNLKDL